MKSLIHKPLSLITKTRIRVLEAFIRGDEEEQGYVGASYARRSALSLLHRGIEQASAAARPPDGAPAKERGCGGMASGTATASSSLLLETQMKNASRCTVYRRQMDICLSKLPLCSWSQSQSASRGAIPSCVRLFTFRSPDRSAPSSKQNLGFLFLPAVQPVAVGGMEMENLSEEFLLVTTHVIITLIRIN